ncbi:cyclin-A3-1-like [Lolium rigidum]|uniref:cyclin-A3-1-like n=1 Tax=Lolium rigidum TaxID=89674 RepID=UPI001F5CC23E|nr:cyclin-A3-1-like [Lolium rigidum]
MALGETKQSPERMEESVGCAADRARLLDADSEPEQTDPVAVRATIASYLEDIDSYMRSLEELRRPRDYMPETLVTPARRAAVVNWLVRVADAFKFPADTLHLAVSYVDRFLSVGVIVRKELQLLAVAAMLLAAKYENGYIHEVEDYTYITDNLYTKQQVVKMESDILNLLKFEMGSPTTRTFLRRYIATCRRGDAKKLEFLCSYLADLSLLDYDCTKFKPSVVAAACLFVARFTINPNTRPWNLMLQWKMDYKVSDLKCCILKIHCLQSIGTYPGLKPASVKDKYNHCELERVSELIPPQEIPEYFLEDIKQ